MELGEQEDYGSELGGEDDDEDEDEDLLPSEDTGKRASSKKDSSKGRFKSKSGTTFASYEEFAHLLDEGLDEAVDKTKKFS